MGNSSSTEQPHVSVLNYVKDRVLDRKRSEIKVEEENRKHGIVSAEAVEWFMERDIKTMRQSLSFVPWIIQKGIKDGSVCDSTDSVCVGFDRIINSRLWCIEEKEL